MLNDFTYISKLQSNPRQMRILADIKRSIASLERYWVLLTSIIISYPIIFTCFVYYGYGAYQWIYVFSIDMTLSLIIYLCYTQFLPWNKNPLREKYIERLNSIVKDNTLSIYLADYIYTPQPSPSMIDSHAYTLESVGSYDNDQRFWLWYRLFILNTAFSMFLITMGMLVF